MRQSNVQSANVADRSRDPSRPYIQASGTLEHGAFGSLVRMSTIRVATDSQYSTLADVARQGSSAQQHHRSRAAPEASQSVHADHLASQTGQDPSSANHTCRGEDQPQAAPHSASEHGCLVIIDSRRMVQSMSARAESLADENDMRYYCEYMEAARVVCRHWTGVLERRSGLSMREDHLTMLLAERIDVALADSGIVNLDQDESVPRSLERYLRKVAQAGIDSLQHV